MYIQCNKKGGLQRSMLYRQIFGFALLNQLFNVFLILATYYQHEAVLTCTGTKPSFPKLYGENPREGYQDKCASTRPNLQ